MKRGSSMTDTVRLDGLSSEDRKALFDRNLKLAEAAAKRYGNRTLPADDLRQAARIGLWRACTSWSPDVGSKLSAYAWVCMHNEMHRATSREAPRPYIHLDGPASQFIGMDHARGPRPLLVEEVLPGQSPNPEAEAARRDGSNVVEIHEAAGRIVRHVKRNGAEWTAADVAAMLAHGMNQSEIAAKLGVTRTRIGQVVEMLREEIARARIGGVG